MVLGMVWYGWLWYGAAHLRTGLGPGLVTTESHAQLHHCYAHSLSLCEAGGQAPGCWLNWVIGGCYYSHHYPSSGSCVVAVSCSRASSLLLNLLLQQLLLLLPSASSTVTLPLTILLPPFRPRRPPYEPQREAACDKSNQGPDQQWL